MMAKKKIVEQEISTSKGKSPNVPKGSAEHQGQAGDDWLSFWGDAVESLQSKSFSGYEEALGAVISEIVDRMPLSGEESAETGQFIRELFELDPVLQEELKSVLNIV
jgi:hypothetical protein